MKDNQLQIPTLASIPVATIFFPLPYRESGKEVVKEVSNAKMIYSSRAGVPYGKTGRSVMSLLSTYALIQDSRKVELGHVSEVFRKLGLDVTGGKTGSVGRVSEQFNRIFNLDMIVEAKKQDKDFHGLIAKRLVVAEEIELFWSEKDKEGIIPLFKNTFTLTQTFFEYLKKHVVEVNLETYLKFQSPRDQDWYAWIVRKMWGVNKSDRVNLISWENLYEQFGPIDRRKKPEFRKDMQEFLLGIVSTVYPELRVRITEEGVQLTPSPLHIPEDKKGYVQE